MKRGVTPDDVRELALALPEVEEGRSWEMPSFKVRKRALAFLREDGETLSLKVDLLEREALIADPSGAFFITPHYEKYPYVVVRLDRVEREELRELLIEAWLREAPKRLAATRPSSSAGAALELRRRGMARGRWSFV